MADHEYRSTTVEVQRREAAYQSFLHSVGNDSLNPKMILDAFFQLYANMFPNFVPPRSRPSHEFDWNFMNHILKDGLDTPESFLCGALFMIHALKVCDNAGYQDKFGLGRPVNSTLDLIRLLPNVKSDFEKEPAFKRQVSVGDVILLPKMGTGYSTSNPMFHCDRLRLFRLPSHAEYNNCVCVHQLILDKKVPRLKAGTKVFWKEPLQLKIRWVNVGTDPPSDGILLPQPYLVSLVDEPNISLVELLQNMFIYITEGMLIRNDNDEVYKPMPRNGVFGLDCVHIWKYPSKDGLLYEGFGSIKIRKYGNARMNTLEDLVSVVENSGFTLISNKHYILKDGSYYKPSTYLTQEGMIESWNSTDRSWNVKPCGNQAERVRPIRPCDLYLSNPDETLLDSSYPIPLYFYRFFLRPNTFPEENWQSIRRTLSRKVHSDKGGDTEESKKYNNLFEVTRFRSVIEKRMRRYLIDDYPGAWFDVFEQCVNFRLINKDVANPSMQAFMICMAIKLNPENFRSVSRETFMDNAVAAIFMCMATGILFENVSPLVSIIHYFVYNQRHKPLQKYWETVIQYFGFTRDTYSGGMYTVGTNSKVEVSIPGWPYLVGEGDEFQLPMTPDLSEQENPLMHKRYAKYVQLAELTFSHTLPHKYTVRVVRLNRSDAVCEALKGHVSTVIPFLPHPFVDSMSVQRERVSLTLVGDLSEGAFLKRDEYLERERFELWLNLLLPFVPVKIYKSGSIFANPYASSAVQVPSKSTNSDVMMPYLKTSLLDRATECGSASSDVCEWNGMFYLKPRPRSEERHVGRKANS